MEKKYQTLTMVGDGTFGQVYKAKNIETGELVAIKKMKQKFFTWEEAMNLNEIKSLRKMKHMNIVKLIEVLRQEDILYMVFEFMTSNVYETFKDKKEQLDEKLIKKVMYDTLQGLAYCHKSGFFHRDLKPENLLVDHNGTVKIADFGLTREIRSRPPFTDYVSTRWYRAPELMLNSTNYNSPIDIFAMGTIMAELYNGSPLFPGTSETDQLTKLCQGLGTPSQQDWPEGYLLAAKLNLSFPKHQGQSLSELVPRASPDAIDLISHMMQIDSQKRPTANQCLQHPFFAADVKAEYQKMLQEYQLTNESVVKKKSMPMPPAPLNPLVTSQQANNNNNSGNTRKTSQEFSPKAYNQKGNNVSPPQHGMGHSNFKLAPLMSNQEESKQITSGSALNNINLNIPSTVKQINTSNQNSNTGGILTPTKQSGPNNINIISNNNQQQQPQTNMPGTSKNNGFNQLLQASEEATRNYRKNQSIFSDNLM